MLNTCLLLFASVFPIALILLFVYIKDKEKEPLVLLLTFFCLGILSAFLVTQITNVLTPIIPLLNMKIVDMTFLEKVLYCFLGVALIEEICKWSMVYFVGYHHREFDELYDIMIYAIFVSLGFALFENIIYVLNSSSMKVALLRAISAIPGHACDAIFMGYYLSIAKVFHFKQKKGLENKNIFLSILTPVLLHGIYDFCLLLISNTFTGSNQYLVYDICIFLFSIFIFTLYIYSYRRIKELSNDNIKIR